MFRSTLVAAALSVAFGDAISAADLQALKGNLVVCTRAAGTDECTAATCAKATWDSDILVVSDDVKYEIVTEASAGEACTNAAAVVDVTDNAVTAITTFECTEDTYVAGDETVFVQGACADAGAEPFIYINSNDLTAASADVAALLENVAVCKVKEDCTSYAATDAECTFATAAFANSALTSTLAGASVKFTSDPLNHSCEAAETVVSVEATTSAVSKINVYSCAVDTGIAVNSAGPVTAAVLDVSAECKTSGYAFVTGTSYFAYSGAVAVSAPATTFGSKLSYCTKEAADACPENASSCKKVSIDSDAKFTVGEDSYTFVTAYTTACENNEARALNTAGVNTIELKKCTDGALGEADVIAFTCGSDSTKWFNLATTDDSSNSVVLGSAVAASVTLAAALATSF